MEILKYFKTPPLKYFIIFNFHYKTFKNMIKVYEVSRKYYSCYSCLTTDTYSWFTYFAAVNCTACNHIVHHVIFEIFQKYFMKHFRNISRNIS